MFDSSVLRGKPSTFPLNRVIAGWTEGVQLMVEGEKRRFWIPEALAYKGQREPKGMLVFDVELISIASMAAPADVKAPPADARKTASGLAYKVIKPGIGGRHPNSSSTVTVHYTGWTTDGKMFDSSVARGMPISFPLDGVIKAGPRAAADGDGRKDPALDPRTRWRIRRSTKPQGMLVFDVELLDFK